MRGTVGCKCFDSQLSCETLSIPQGAIITKSSIRRLDGTQKYVDSLLLNRLREINHVLLLQENDKVVRSHLLETDAVIYATDRTTIAANSASRYNTSKHSTITSFKYDHY
jgi:hypothetical protein